MAERNHDQILKDFRSVINADDAKLGTRGLGGTFIYSKKLNLAVVGGHSLYKLSEEGKLDTAKQWLAYMYNHHDSRIFGEEYAKKKAELINQTSEMQVLNQIVQRRQTNSIEVKEKNGR